MTFPRAFRPQLEWLGERIQPAIVLDNTGGELKIFGTAGADVVHVQLVDANTLQVSINTTGEVRTFALSQVSRIELKGGGGNDVLLIAAGITLPSEISGGRGQDTVRGGGGDDSIDGGLGDDNINGRGGSDTCQGGAGNDVVIGGSGDDSCFGGSGNDNLGGGAGRDVCNGGGGDDSVSGGLNSEVEYTAPLTGSGSGSGNAKFEFSATGTGEREFRVRVNGVTPSGQQLDVFVDGVRVGTIALNSSGSGELKFELDLNPDDSGHVNFPPDFPEISTGSVVTVQANGTVVLQGTFGVGSTDDNGSGSGGGGGSGGGHGSDDPLGDDHGGGGDGSDD